MTFNISLNKDHCIILSLIFAILYEFDTKLFEHYIFNNKSNNFFIYLDPINQKSILTTIIMLFTIAKVITVNFN